MLATAVTVADHVAVQMMEMTNDLNKKEDEARVLRQSLLTALDDMATVKVHYNTLY